VIKDKKKIADFVLKTLNALYPNPEVPLDHKDPFTLLIAVLLSAQCTDKRVNTITPKLFSLADTPKKMIQLPVETIEQVIGPCGLYKRKAKAILELSEQLIKKHKGIVPNTLDELEALSGVGHKTASVVMIQAHNLPAFPVDTHIFRCARRWNLSQGKNVKEVEEDLKKLFAKKVWIKLHLQIILFARQYCQARGHNINNCPICSKIIG